MARKPKTLQFADFSTKYLSARIVTQQYRAAVQRIAKAAGEMTAERLNRYCTSRIEKVSGQTVRTERTILLSIWRWAYDQGLVEVAPRGVLTMRARRKPTKAWTVEQLQALVKSTKDVQGRTLRSGADLGVMLRAWILLGYECGGRYGDLWSLSREHLERDTISWTQSKTGDPIVRTLTPACLDAVDAMLARSPDGRILGWACQRRQAMRHMRQHIDKLGIGGTSKWLRRAGATHIEISDPGKARLHLGHRSVGLAESNYIDWSQVRKHAPRTPALV